MLPSHGLPSTVSSSSKVSDHHNVTLPLVPSPPATTRQNPIVIAESNPSVPFPHSNLSSMQARTLALPHRTRIVHPLLPDPRPSRSDPQSHHSLSSLPNSAALLLSKMLSSVKSTWRAIYPVEML